MSEIREGRLMRPDGRTVAWSESGVADGLPVLRIPGTPGSRLSLRADQAPWFDRSLRVITTERPGYGASTRLPGRGFAEHAADLAAILDELGLAAVPIYGASGAAPHILAFAALHADRVRAASVAVGAAPLEGTEADEMIGLNQASYRLARAGDRDGLRVLIEPVRVAVLADPLASFREVMATAPPGDQAIMADPLWQEAFALGVREALRQGVEGWVDEGMALAGDWTDFDPGTVSTSLTWWHGDHDRNAPLSAARRLVSRLPNGRVVVWPDTGHLTSYLHEAEILDELLARM